MRPLLSSQLQQPIGQRTQRAQQQIPEGRREIVLQTGSGHALTDPPRQSGTVLIHHAQLLLGHQRGRCLIIPLPGGGEPGGHAAQRILPTHAAQQQRHVQQQGEEAVGQTPCQPQQQSRRQQQRQHCQHRAPAVPQIHGPADPACQQIPGIPPAPG